jgi:hypothetical protein
MYVRYSGIKDLKKKACAIGMQFQLLVYACRG